MPAVQFFGKTSVLTAAENLECPAWGIFIGRNLFTKYEGSDMSESLGLLDRNLDALQEGGTAAIYTLKFFEQEDGRPIKISEKTVCNCGSFNFKLLEPEQRMELYGRHQDNQAIAALQEQVAKLAGIVERVFDEPDPEPDPVPVTIGSVLQDAIQNPEHAMQLINLGRSLLGLPVSQNNPVAIGNVPAAGNDPESRLQRLSAALDQLEQVDPQLLEHLEKLADMSRKDPGKFKMLISML